MVAQITVKWTLPVVAYAERAGCNVVPWRSECCVARLAAGWLVERCTGTVNESKDAVW